MSLEEIKGMMGTKLDFQPIDAACPMENVALPDNFKYTDNWPQCESKVLNQG
jgi:hypothetical protein